MTVFVVGLDGAEWSLLGPWMDDRGLPALSRLCDAGVAGGLRSTLPPVTFPAWKCYSTGKTPGRLGVYEWFALDREGPRIETNDSASFRSREYWDVLADEGHAPATVNMPTTHPPNVDEGVRCVAGSPASERGGFTSPASLKPDLLDAVPGYRVKPDLVLDEATPEDLVAEATTLAGQRFDAAEWLADDGADLVHLTVFVTDTLQHRLWDRPAYLRRLYETIDRRLGDLLDRDDAEAVVVMSDHGFVDIDERFYPNQWLLDRGDLVVGEDAARGALASLGLTEERAKRLVARLGLVNLAQAVVPDAVHSLFPSESGRTAIQGAPIDWTATKAISLGWGPIYLNDAAFDSRAAAASYRDELADALRDIRTPAGDPVATAVHDPADVYTGEMARAPDLLVEYATGVNALKGGSAVTPSTTRACGSRPTAGRACSRPAASGSRTDRPRRRASRRSSTSTTSRRRSSTGWACRCPPTSTARCGATSSRATPPTGASRRGRRRGATRVESAPAQRWKRRCGGFGIWNE
jgi:predicted AlkP superfamily phosphohydrolase/phosphomutase